MRTKIKTHDELAEIVREEKTLRKTVGFTNGCFDILHTGHVRYLRGASKECDVLIVGVNSDSSVKSIKGEGRPINRQDDRLEVLMALSCIDFLTLFEEDTPEELIKKIRPEIIFKGGDWKEEDVVGADHVKAEGGRARIIPYLKGYSTTELIKRIQKNDK